MSGVSQSEYQSILDRFVKVDLFKLVENSLQLEPAGEIALKIADSFDFLVKLAITFRCPNENPFDIIDHVVFDSDLKEKLISRIRKGSDIEDAVMSLLEEDKDLVAIIVEDACGLGLVLGYGRR
jgi:hypothetical protein